MISLEISVNGQVIHRLQPALWTIRPVPSAVTADHRKDERRACARLVRWPMRPVSRYAAGVFRRREIKPRPPIPPSNSHAAAGRGITVAEIPPIRTLPCPRLSNNISVTLSAVPFKRILYQVFWLTQNVAVALQVWFG